MLCEDPRTFSSLFPSLLAVLSKNSIEKNLPYSKKSEFAQLRSKLHVEVCMAVVFSLVVLSLPTLSM